MCIKEGYAALQYQLRRETVSRAAEPTSPLSAAVTELRWRLSA